MPIVTQHPVCTQHDLGERYESAVGDHHTFGHSGGATGETDTTSICWFWPELDPPIRRSSDQAFVCEVPRRTSDRDQRRTEHFGQVLGLLFELRSVEDGSGLYLSPIATSSSMARRWFRGTAIIATAPVV